MMSKNNNIKHAIYAFIVFSFGLVLADAEMKLVASELQGNFTDSDV